MPGPYEAFEVTVIKVVASAVLLEFEIDDERLWIPWKHLADRDEEFDEGWYGTVHINRQFAQQKGLI